MLIKLSNIIEITEPTKEIIDYCKKELVFKNPDYDKKKRMGFYTGGISKTINLYNLYQNKLYLPIGCFDMLWKIHPIKTDYADYSVIKSKNIKSNIVLRNYQKPCAEALKKYVNGIFILPAG